MRFKHLVLLLTTIYLLLIVFSYGLVDYNFPLGIFRPYLKLFFSHRLIITAAYLFLISVLFVTYLYLLKQVREHRLNLKQTWLTIIFTITLLFIAWPGFSYDIFNYIVTAKVTYGYHENPYLTMPIEFTEEPMLKFMHAANKTALYGPVWIALTAVPHFFGFGNLLLTIFTFKLLIVLFYLLCCWLIWKITKNTYSLLFFALNPLVVVETLVSGHNDVVMMGLALLAFYFISQNKKLLSWLMILFSIGIKYATIVLVPLLLFHQRIDKKRLIMYAVGLMMFVFLLSPIREEMYSWYLIWIIPFVALIPKNKALRWITISFSFGLMLRFLPYLYTGSWEGDTPIVKKIVTIVPLLVTGIFLIILTKKPLMVSLFRKVKIA